MNPGEHGHVLRFETEKRILAGGSCVLLVTHPDGTVGRLFAQPSTDGMSCTRTTASTDFPVPGRYAIELDADLADGSDDNSLVMYLDVGQPPPK